MLASEIEYNYDHHLNYEFLWDSLSPRFNYNSNLVKEIKEAINKEFGS